VSNALAIIIWQLKFSDTMKNKLINLKNIANKLTFLGSLMVYREGL
jgi:hypothetical protein